MATSGTSLHRLALCGGCARQFDLSLDDKLSRLAPGDGFRCSCGAEVTVPSLRAEEAAVVACAACGAPREGGALHCTFCGSDFTLRDLDLDAVCPRCGARVSRRGRFCHHCSLPLTAPREGAASGRRCPACSPPPGGEEREDAGEAPRLVSRRVAGGHELHLFVCPSCAGLWLDRDVFNALVESATRGRSGLPAPPAVSHHPAAPGGIAERGWSYRPCAVCGGLMNRRNYAKKSGVVVDLCKRHGIWFDGDELHRVLTWVQGGGATETEVRASEPRPSATVAGGLPGGGLEPWGGERGWWSRGGLLLDVVLVAFEAVLDWVSDR